MSTVKRHMFPFPPGMATGARVVVVATSAALVAAVGLWPHAAAAWCVLWFVVTDGCWGGWSCLHPPGWRASLALYRVLGTAAMVLVGWGEPLIADRHLWGLAAVVGGLLLFVVADGLARTWRVLRWKAARRGGLPA